MEFSDSEEIDSPEEGDEEKGGDRGDEEEGSDSDADHYKNRGLSDRLRRAVSQETECF